MARMTVGGRTLDITKDDILEAMRRVEPEPIREHLVEIGKTVYPPKQVLATVTGWERTTFTTMEAQRVLTKVGFVCRRAGHEEDGRAAWITATSSAQPVTIEDRVEALETALVIAHQAIVGLTSRIASLEARP